MELDRSVLRERAKSKEQAQLEEIMEFVQEMIQDQNIDLPLVNKFSSNFKKPLNESVIEELKSNKKPVPQLEISIKKSKYESEVKVLPEPEVKVSPEPEIKVVPEPESL